MENYSNLSKLQLEELLKEKQVKLSYLKKENIMLKSQPFFRSDLGQEALPNNKRALAILGKEIEQITKLLQF